MRKLLLPVGASEPGRLRTAVAAAVRIHRREQVPVHVLCVQPRVSSHVAMYFGPGELQQLQLDAGQEDLLPVQALLDAAGVPYTTSVRVGRSAETIALAAQELGCDRIVLGEEEGGLAQKMFGSLAEQVRHIVHGMGAVHCQVIGS